MDMNASYFERAGAERDKKLFTESVIRIRSQQELTEFIDDYGMNNFNATLKTLDSEDYKKVTGRAQSLRLFGK
jgi:hypothetical protein